MNDKHTKQRKELIQLLYELEGKTKIQLDNRNKFITILTSHGVIGFLA